MAPPRAYWTGHVRLSLVTFPVRLYAAVTSTSKIQLHKYNRETGERVHYQDVSGKDREAVDKEDIVKGYEYEKGRYVPIEDEELEKLRAESGHTIDLIQFTQSRNIDPIYYDRPYFMTPDDKIAHEAYITVREALRQAGKVALGQIVIGGRERIAAIKPCGNGLILETLRYAYEVREADKYFDELDKDAAIDKEQLKLAAQLIDAKTAPFDPKDFKNSYQEGLMEIIEAKLAHRKVELKEPAEEPGTVVNIMDALKKSLEETKKKKKPASKKSKDRKKAA